MQLSLRLLASRLTSPFIPVYIVNFSSVSCFRVCCITVVLLFACVRYFFCALYVGRVVCFQRGADPTEQSVIAGSRRTGSQKVCLTANRWSVARTLNDAARQSIGDWVVCIIIASTTVIGFIIMLAITLTHVATCVTPAYAYNIRFPNKGTRKGWTNGQ